MRTVLVASSKGGAGKTSIATNLAAHFALGGKPLTFGNLEKAVPGDTAATILAQAATVAVVGIQTLARVDFHDHRNVVIVGTSLGLAMFVTAQPGVAQAVPDWAQIILGSGITLGERVACTIYENRPQVCHDFDAGSDRCHEYRRIYGLEPRLTESEIASALRSLERVEKKERIMDARIVEAGTVTHFSFSFGDEEGTTTESVRLKIVVFLEDETSHEIHSFDPAEEIWFETDFVPLTLAEARELIASRRTQELM